MTAQTFIDRLSTRGRILMLGGLAVIAHGLSRSTRDTDIWLEPFADPREWSEVLREVIAEFRGTAPYDLRGRRRVSPGDIEGVVARDGVIRISGLDRGLDVFRTPHNMTTDDFHEVWQRAAMNIPGVRIPEDIDILVTKEETSRPQDIADISFLEEKIRKRLSRTLPDCSLQQAEAIFQRYADHATCESALQNRDAGVQRLAMQTLKAFADAGDPFAERTLRDLKSPRQASTGDD